MGCKAGGHCAGKCPFPTREGAGGVCRDDHQVALLPRPSREQSFTGPVCLQPRAPEEAAAFPRAQPWCSVCRTGSPMLGPTSPASLPSWPDSVLPRPHCCEPQQGLWALFPTPASPGVQWGLGQEGCPLQSAPAFPPSPPLSPSRLEVRHCPGPGHLGKEPGGVPEPLLGGSP